MIKTNLLAELFGVTPQAINNWRKDPNKKIISLLEKYFYNEELIEFIENGNIQSLDQYRGKYISIGERIKIIREQLNLKQKDLAEKLGTTQAAISRYEKNERSPDAVLLEKLVQSLDINPTWLLGSGGRIFKEKEE